MSPDHTIPIYAGAFVFILGFSFASDFAQNKPRYIAICGFGGCICFIITVAVTTHVVQCRLFVSTTLTRRYLPHLCL